MSNGCGAEGGFDFKIIKNKIEKLPFFDKSKVEKLYSSIEKKCCTPHDNAFDIGGNFFDYIKANYIFARDLIRILHWTTIFGRLSIFLITFFLLNIFSFRYFNFHK